MRFDELKTPAYVIDEKMLATYCWRRKHFQHMQNIR